MTKTRKKKNYKLRRRVKRTIAALIMIMAVVVAAIPVENLGTTQAAGGNWEDTISYATYVGNDNGYYHTLAGLTPTTSYSVTGQKMQIMANGTLSSPLVADLSSSSNGASAVITGFNNTSRGDQ